MSWTGPGRMCCTDRTVAAFVLVGLVLTWMWGSATAWAQQIQTKTLTQLAEQENRGAVLLYQRSRDWFVTCRAQQGGKSRRCELSSLAKARADERPTTFGFKIVLDKDNKQGIGFVETPLDLLISRGVEFTIDKSRVGKLTFRSCHSHGCVVPFSLKGSIGRRLSRGTGARFVFRDMKDAKETIDFSLLGISNALRVARKFL